MTLSRKRAPRDATNAPTLLRFDKLLAAATPLDYDSLK